MGNLSIRCWAGKNAGAEVASAPALIGFDVFRFAIPCRVALQQSPPPLHQPGAVCCTLGSPVEHFAANGDLSLNCLSHPRGQAQTTAWRLFGGLLLVLAILVVRLIRKHLAATYINTA